MAKGVGLDAGVFEVKVVELDGSYRRPRLAKVSIDRVPPSAESDGGERRARLEAEAALHALKDQNVSRHGVNLGFPSRDAVIRNLTIPFVGDDAIRKVIKFEAENAIHSHNVDDMVVDFQTYARGDGESSVLVAAVPKKSLAPLLEALEEQGIEPERVDLDAMALFRAAEWAGCFGEDAAEAAAAAAEGEADESPSIASPALLPSTSGRRARIVVDVGARATRVLAVVEGLLIDLRALRPGADAIAERIAIEFGLGLDEARDVVAVGLDSGRDVALDTTVDTLEDEAGPDPDAEPTAEASDAVVPRPAIVPYDAIVAARDDFLVRLKRELLRFLTALPRVAEVERLFVTGSGAAIAQDGLSEVFRCPPQPLDVLGKLAHDLDPTEAAQIGPRIATAVGLALGMLGGKGGFDFRKEELSYRRHFDRVKFPLAIACMLAVFLPFIYGVRQYKQLEGLGKQYGELFEVKESTASARGSGDRIEATFWGHVGYLMNERMANRVNRQLGATEFTALTKELVARDTYTRLPAIRSQLAKRLQQQQEQTGVYESLQLPSGVYVLSYFAKVIQDVEERLGSFLIVDLELNLPANEKARTLAVNVAIRGDAFRQRYEVLRQAFQATFDDPASPFGGFARGQGGGEDPFMDSTTPGAYFNFRLEVKPDFGTRPQ